jgi:hypothetical protein
MHHARHLGWGYIPHPRHPLRPCRKHGGAPGTRECPSPILVPLSPWVPKLVPTALGNADSRSKFCVDSTDPFSSFVIWCEQTCSSVKIKSFSSLVNGPLSVFLSCAQRRMPRTCGRYARGHVELHRVGRSLLLSSTFSIRSRASPRICRHSAVPRRTSLYVRWATVSE